MALSSEPVVTEQRRCVRSTSKGSGTAAIASPVNRCREHFAKHPRLLTGLKGFKYPASNLPLPNSVGKGKTYASEISTVKTVGTDAGAMVTVNEPLAVPPLGSAAEALRVTVVAVSLAGASTEKRFGAEPAVMTTAGSLAVSVGANE